MFKRLVALIQPYWMTIRVVGTFVGIIFAFFMTTDYAPIADHFNVAGGLARIAALFSGWFLKGLGGLIGFPVQINGTRLGSGPFVVDVTEACSGAVPTAIYLAAVAAYPASWRAKMIGAGIGFGVINSINVLRVIALFLVGLFASQYFHDTHVYVAQALVVVIAVATWIFWAGRFADAPGR
jgi:exosortase/archaeosortase family protein